MWTGFNWFKVGVIGCCEHGNELLDPLKDEKFSEQQTDYYLLLSAIKRQYDVVT
jgi:hypothetical protein